MRRFKDCFSLWPTVSFPTPVCGLAKEEVLIETFEDGVSISNYLMEPAATEAMDRAIQKAKAEANGGRKGGGGADAAASRVDEITRTAAEQNAAAAAMATFVPEENSVLAALGVKTLLKMLIDDNFLHADLHPGNILVRLPGGMRGGMPGGAKDAKEGRAMDDDDAKKDASSERNGGNGNGKAATKGAGRLPKVPSSGAFYTLVPIRPRSRGERRSLRTLPGASLRPPLPFNPRPRRLSTPTDAFELQPDIRL